MKTPSSRDPAIEIARSVAIRRPPPDVYRFWREAENLQRVSDPRISISPTSNTSSHWTVRIPGRQIEWDADIVRDSPDREIAWRARAGTQIPNSGSVRFEALTEHETNVTLSLAFHPPAGPLGKLLGNVGRQKIANEVGRALERTKTQLEHGPSASQ